MSRRGFSLALSALFLLPFLLSLQTAPPASASPGWWDTAWTKRRAITVGAHPENYQILIELPFSDSSIRFLESEDSGLLPYWVESDNGSGMKVWVRRMENADSTIYVYYGNAGAASQSSVENTFIAIIDNLIGAWHMDENTSSTFSDSSGNGHTGVMLGTSWTEGKFGSGHSYNGSSSKDNIENFTSGLENSFTISLWFKPNSVHWTELFFVWAPSTTQYWTHLGIYHDSSATVDLYDGTNRPHVNSGSIHYTVGEWNHFVNVRNTTADNFSGYLNNTCFGTVTDTTAFVPEYLYILLGMEQWISGGNIVQAHYFNGTLDEILIFSKALSSSEISLLYSYYAYSTTNCPHTALIRRGYSLPSITLGGEETIEGIIFTDITGDNLLLDRDVDTSWGAVTSTRLQADVEWQSGITGVTKENVRFVLKDKNGTVVDNQPADDNLWLADNRQRFFRAFNLASYSIADNALGSWTVRMEVWASSFGSAENSCLTVDDLTTTVGTENLPGHQLRAYGTASRISGSSLSSIDNARIVDTYGTYTAQISGAGWENTWSPAGGGSFVVHLRGGAWDGESENKPYAFPNFAPSVSISVSPSLVDRDQDFSGSGASTTATFTITASDPDNDNLTFRLLLYDNTSTLRENVEVGGTYAYDPPDNLSDAALGGWTAEAVAADPYGGERENTTGFVAADLTSTLAFSPATIYSGWPVTVSGTVSGRGYAATVDNIWLEDNLTGTYLVSPATNWNHGFTADGNLGEAGEFTVRLRDYSGGSAIDGENSLPYTVSEDQLFQVELRYEENGQLVNLTGHSFVAKFWWNQENVGSATFTAAQNPENFVVPSGGENCFLARVYDGENYWRARVPTGLGGILTFLVPPENSTYYQYTFTLVDYTQLFRTGWVQLSCAEGVVNEDWWDASGYSYAYLLLHGYYTVRLCSADGRDMFSLQHFQAESDLTPPAWEVSGYAEAENIVYMFDLISLQGYRDELGIHAVWSCSDDRTSLLEVNVYGRDNTWMAGENYAYPTYAEFLWTGAENEESYRLVLVTHHALGTYETAIPIGAFFPVLPPPPPPGGFPVPLLSLASLGILTITALTFVRPFLVPGLFVLAGMTSVLEAMGWLGIGWGAVAFVWLIAFLAAVAEGMR